LWVSADLAAELLPDAVVPACYFLGDPGD